MDYKFTLLTPTVITKKGPDNMNDPMVNDFARSLKSCAEDDYNMKCFYPTDEGDAFITSFDVFEDRFLRKSEYALILISQATVKAMTKFYPRLLVFLSVRKTWSNRFVLLFVGPVTLEASVELDLLKHPPIEFSLQWCEESEQDSLSWTQLFGLLKVTWMPHHSEDSSSEADEGPDQGHAHGHHHGHDNEFGHGHSHSNSSVLTTQTTTKSKEDYSTNAPGGSNEEVVRKEIADAGFTTFIETKQKIVDHQHTALGDVTGLKVQGSSLENVDSASGGTNMGPDTHAHSLSKTYTSPDGKTTTEQSLVQITNQSKQEGSNSGAIGGSEDSESSSGPGTDDKKRRHKHHHKSSAKTISSSSKTITTVSHEEVVIKTNKPTLQEENSSGNIEEFPVKPVIATSLGGADKGGMRKATNGFEELQESTGDLDKKAAKEFSGGRFGSDAKEKDETDGQLDENLSDTKTTGWFSGGGFWGGSKDKHEQYNSGGGFADGDKDKNKTDEEEDNSGNSEETKTSRWFSGGGFWGGSKDKNEVEGKLDIDPDTDNENTNENNSKFGWLWGFSNNATVVDGNHTHEEEENSNHSKSWNWTFWRYGASNKEANENDFDVDHESQTGDSSSRYRFWNFWWGKGAGEGDEDVEQPITKETSVSLNTSRLDESSEVRHSRWRIFSVFRYIFGSRSQSATDEDTLGAREESLEGRRWFLLTFIRRSTENVYKWILVVHFYKRDDEIDIDESCQSGAAYYLRHPFCVPLMLIAATAASPYYHLLSQTAFDALAAFLAKNASLIGPGVGIMPPIILDAPTKSVVPPGEMLGNDIYVVTRHVPIERFPEGLQYPRTYFVVTGEKFAAQK